MKIPLVIGAIVVASCASIVSAFDNDSLVVVRLGDGSGTVPFDTNYLAQPTFLDIYSTMTGNLINTINLPSTGSLALTLTSRNDDHDGRLNFSNQANLLTLGGYRADSGAPYSVTASGVGRVIGVVDANGNVDTSTSLDDAFIGATINAAVTTDGSEFWVGGKKGGSAAPLSGGLRYVANLGDSTSINVSQTQVIGGPLQPDEMRNLRLYDGQLYINTPAQNSFGDRGLWKATTPLPRSGSDDLTVTRVITNHEGFTTDYYGNIDPDGKGKLHPKSDSILLDLDNDPLHLLETAYSTGGKDELEKWQFDGSNWTRADLIYLASGEEINALSYVTTPLSVNVFISTDSGVYRLLDEGGPGAIVAPFLSDPNNDPEMKKYLTSAYFIEAGANTEFRGLAYVPEPTTLATLALGAMVGLRRKR